MEALADTILVALVIVSVVVLVVSIVALNKVRREEGFLGDHSGSPEDPPN